MMESQQGNSNEQQQGKGNNMFSAVSFVNRAKEGTFFEICIDNEWHYDLDREKAFSLIVDYETKMSEEFPGEWNADVMEFWPAKDEPNLIVMTIL